MKKDLTNAHEKGKGNNSRNTEKTFDWSKEDIYQSLAVGCLNLTHKRKSYSML